MPVLCKTNKKRMSMNPQSNKNIIKELAKTFSSNSKLNSDMSLEVKSYFEDIRHIDETQDLITSLNYNLSMLTQSEKRLNFMIGEVKSTIKKRI